MYGVPQAEKIANQLLTKRLSAKGNMPTKRTPGLWRHITKHIAFILILDDFSVKYTKKEDAKHLFLALKQWYNTKID